MKFNRSRSAVGNLQQYDDQLRSIKCIREMASMLVLAHTGVELDEDRMDELHANVSSVREEFGLYPEDIQSLLEIHEPALALSD